MQTLGAVLAAALAMLAPDRPLVAQTWTATGSVAAARVNGTITMLANGKVLIAGGGTNAGYLAEAELYDPITGAFTVTGSMTTPRSAHTATLLPDGTVLIAGGQNSSGDLTSAELYDPSTGMFTATGRMTTARSLHTATLLPDGKVLLAAGHTAYPPPTATATGELYDPSTGTFTPTGSMLAARWGARAVLLGNAKVLITGGFPGGTGVNFLSEAELYDPTTGTFGATGSMNTARYAFTMTRLNNGQVLVAGGTHTTLQGSDLSSAELYDPSAGQWSFTGSMAIAAEDRTATLLGNGQVLVAGGDHINGQGYFSEAELYDPVAGSFSVTASMTTARENAVATLLSNGNVLVAGGFSGSAYLSSAELYRGPSTVLAWTATGSMATARVNGTITMLANGKVLVAGGGTNAGYLAEAELYDPITGTFTVTGTMTTPRSAHTATLLPDGTVLIAGGQNSSGDLTSAELYDPSTGMFTATGHMSTARSLHTATLLPDGKVLLAGGHTAYPPPTATATAELYDPSADTFTPTGSMVAARWGAQAVLLGNGKVVITGGFPGGTGVNFLSEAELYDPTTGTFSATGGMNTARGSLTMTRLNNGEVLAVGGAHTTLQGSDLSSAELYDPSAGQWNFTGSMAIAALDRTATLLGDGKVLVAGGTLMGEAVYFSEAELYDSETGNFTVTASMTATRHLALSALLGNGNVLVAGGFNGAYLSSAELYKAASSITLSPTSLSFSDQLVNTSSAPQSVTLSNTGTVALTISGLTFAGDNATDFSQTNACSASLPGGGSCTIEVTFTPTAPGTRTANLVITDNASPSPQTLSLTGTGTGAPVGSVSPGIVRFGNQLVGTPSAPQVVTLSNTGSAALTISNIVASTTLSSTLSMVGGDFSQTNNCASSVAPGSSCTINVTFTPRATGTRTGTLTINDNGSGATGSEQAVTLTGTGTALSQTINFDVLANQPYGTAPFPVSATASSGLPVTFNSQTPAVCTVSGATVTLVSVGTCTIQATQGGNANYAAASPVNQSFQVTKASQTITFGALSNQVLGAAPFTVSATASSGLAVSFASTTTAVCTVAGNTVTLVTAGTCTIQATQAGNANYAAATPVDRSFQVIGPLASTKTTLVTLPNPSVYGGEVTFTAEVSCAAGVPPNGEIVAFMNGAAVLGAGTLSGGTASFTTSALPAGTDSITAVYSGDAEFTGSTSNKVSESVGKAGTTTTLTSSAAPFYPNVAVTFTAIVTFADGTPPNGETITFERGTAKLGTATLSGGRAILTTSGLPVGTDSVTAVYGGDVNLAGSSSTITLSVVAPPIVVVNGSLPVDVWPNPQYWTVEITNKGPGAAYNVRLVSATVNGIGGSASPSTNVGTLAAGASSTITITGGGVLQIVFPNVESDTVTWTGGSSTFTDEFLVEAGP
jgi:hypothetical protein